jgi:putative acetyltransferase
MNDPVMTISPVDPALPAALALIAKLDDLHVELYPAESNHLDGIEILRRPNVLFLGAFVAGDLVGCGAVKRVADDGEYGEIKRVYVQGTHRGRGVAKSIMAALEAHLLDSGVALARLETGIHQPEAIGMYRRLGYRERGPYGGYRPDPLSVFMEKNLRAQGSQG